MLLSNVEVASGIVELELDLKSFPHLKGLVQLNQQVSGRVPNELQELLPEPNEIIPILVLLKEFDFDLLLLDFQLENHVLELFENLQGKRFRIEKALVEGRRVEEVLVLSALKIEALL